MLNVIVKIQITNYKMNSLPSKLKIPEYYRFINSINNRIDDFHINIYEKPQEPKDLDKFYDLVKKEFDGFYSNYESQFNSRLIEHQVFQFIVGFCRNYNLDDKVLSDDEIRRILENENFDIFQYSILFEVYYICISNYEHKNLIQNLRTIIKLKINRIKSYSALELEKIGLLISWDRIKDNLNYAFTNSLFYNDEYVY